MSVLPLSDVKARLSEIAEEVGRTHERVHITKNGKDYVVLMAAEDLESMEATLELLADPAAQERIARARGQIARGEGLCGADEARGRGGLCRCGSAAVAERALRAPPVTYQVTIAPTAPRQLHERLPEAVA